MIFAREGSETTYLASGAPESSPSKTTGSRIQLAGLLIVSERSTPPQG